MDLCALPSDFATNTAVAAWCVLLPSDSDSSKGRWIRLWMVTLTSFRFYILDIGYSESLNKGSRNGDNYGHYGHNYNILDPFLANMSVF